jgi:hypothetical protein
MNSQHIQNNIRVVCDDFSKEEFVYHFLLAYGISKTSVTRLKKGDFNLSKNHKAPCTKRVCRVARLGRWQ